MRQVKITPSYLRNPAGSCLVEFGDTRVICAATIEDKVPPFLYGPEGPISGWLTAEYGMLPGSTGGSRKRREIGKRDGRSVEIQRLIGRSLRAAVDLPALGETTIIMDLDVLEADGGTRTAAISGGWVALYQALGNLARKQGKPGADSYCNGQVAAVSAGIVDGEIICDLDYEHDSRAEVDMNIVKLDDELVEVQGTGERSGFTRRQLDQILDAAEEGIQTIYQVQKTSISTIG
ncbi:MAG: ribonuclease PH [Spirochaetales bacterium]|nr:ribonuclease PH [Spirochaetales bacterium]MCF7938306.1 ribonuclease PH [Spirochaetales bacterium]